MRDLLEERRKASHGNTHVGERKIGLDDDADNDVDMEQVQGSSAAL